MDYKYENTFNLLKGKAIKRMRYHFSPIRLAKM